MAERIGNKLVAVDLSVDQTPFRKDKLERVKRYGSASRAVRYPVRHDKHIPPVRQVRRAHALR
jgi:hypothetical protein